MPKKIRELEATLAKAGFVVLPRRGKGVTMPPRYSIVIQWSEADQLYVVSLPEFGPYAHTHGKTYDEALAMAKDCLETLIDVYQTNGKTLPEPNLYGSEGK